MGVSAAKRKKQNAGTRQNGPPLSVEFVSWSPRTVEVLSSVLSMHGRESTGRSIADVLSA